MNTNMTGFRCFSKIFALVNEGDKSRLVTCPFMGKLNTNMTGFRCFSKIFALVNEVDKSRLVTYPFILLCF